MPTITTSTSATPLSQPVTTLVDRSQVTAALYVMVRTATNTYGLYRSTDAGATWALFVSLTRSNLIEMGPILVMHDPYDHLVWCYRTNESSEDRIYVRTMQELGTATGWNSEVLVAAAGNGGAAGAVYTGLDVQTAVVPGVLQWVAVAAGTTSGSQHGVTVFALAGGTPDSLAVNNGSISGTRQWLHTGSGRITPALDIQHNGDGKTAGTPNLWLAFGRTKLWMAKLAWTGAGWSGPASDQTLLTSMSAQNGIGARWDGTRFLIPVVNPASGSTVLVLERNKANSSTTNRTTPTHPQGTVRNCCITYDAPSGDMRVYAVGTSTDDLYLVDFTRLTATWGTWILVTSTDILGADQWSIRRSTYGTAKFDVVTAAAGSPNVVTFASLTRSYAPLAPTWQSPPTGQAADVAAALLLDWQFNDPDPSDTQSSYALSRQIGAGALAYWRASDSTWQPAEVQNTATTTSVVLPAGWGADPDAQYAYKVKTWDQTPQPSVYSDAVIVIPSTKVNPTITSPTSGQVITSNQVTIVWTVAEQTQYRVTLSQGVLDTFTRTVAGGWGTADTGQVWSTSGGLAADYSVSGGYGNMSVSAVNSFRFTLMPEIRTDLYESFNVTVPVVATGNSISMGRVVHWQSAGNYYLVSIEAGIGGTFFNRITKYVGGPPTSLALSTVVGTYTAGDQFGVDIQVVGSTIRSRVWKVGDPVPTTWTLEVVDTTFASGQSGFAALLLPSNTNALPQVIKFDNLLSQDNLAPTYDSGWVSDPDARSVTPPTILADNSGWIATVRTQNIEGLQSDRALVAFTVDYVEPPTPTLVVTPDPPAGVIHVTVTNPPPVGGQPAVATQDLYRRLTAVQPSRTPCAADPNYGVILNANPYFETNASSWTGVGTTSIARSTVQAHDGVASLLITPNGVAVDAYAESEKIPVTAGMTYQAEAWVWATTGNKPVRIQLRWYTAGGVFVSSTSVQGLPTAGTWAWWQVQGIPPSTATQVTIAVGVSSTPAAGDTVYIDGAKLTVANLDPGVLVTSGVDINSTVDDWKAVDGVSYEYQMVTYGVNGSVVYSPWTP